MSAVAVAAMLDIIACLIAWWFEIPPPGTGGAGGPVPDGLYVATGIMYGWFWLPVGYILTKEKGS